MSPPPLMKHSFLFLVLFFLISLHSLSGCASASAGTFRAHNSVAFASPEVMELKGGRKLIGVTGLLLDYEPPGANPAHDPQAPGKKGGRGGNP